MVHSSSETVLPSRFLRISMSQVVAVPDWIRISEPRRSSWCRSATVFVVAVIPADRPARCLRWFGSWGEALQERIVDGLPGLQELAHQRLESRRDVRLEPRALEELQQEGRVDLPQLVGPGRVPCLDREEDRASDPLDHGTLQLLHLRLLEPDLPRAGH